MHSWDFQTKVVQLTVVSNHSLTYFLHFRNTGELVVGIIDYIRTFTWDKKLEM